MKVTITDVVPDPHGLRMGLRIEHEKAGWVRFGVTLLVVDRLTFFERQALLSALDHAAGNWEVGEDIPLFP